MGCRREALGRRRACAEGEAGGGDGPKGGSREVAGALGEEGKWGATLEAPARSGGRPKVGGGRGSASGSAAVVAPGATLPILTPESEPRSCNPAEP